MQKSRLFIRMGKNVARTTSKPRRAEPNHNASIFQPPARAQQPKRIRSFPPAGSPETALHEQIPKNLVITDE